MDKVIIEDDETDEPMPCIKDTWSSTLIRYEVKVIELPPLNLDPSPMLRLKAIRSR